MLLGGCLSKETKIPEGVLSRQEMVRVLIDVHILEAKVKKLYLSKDSMEAVYNHYERKLFEDLGVDRAVYQRSFSFYVDHLDLMEQVYNEVSDSLLARSKSYEID